MSKRAVRPSKMTTQALLDFDLGESSSDSDFCIEDEQASDDCSDTSKDNSDTDDNSSNDNNDKDNDSDNDSDDSTKELKQLLSAGDNETAPKNADFNENLKKLCEKYKNLPAIETKPICCICLGDRSDGANEIVECDGCSVSVHEGCYGVNDNDSMSSTDSNNPTTPWFCEACRVGVFEPPCELCPNKGGIYKETDVGKWVHLLCALYVPGVAFGDVDGLGQVTLFEMQYSKWGAKVCTLCENPRYARTGVCIGCDAGMCKTFFHVTCAQAAGFITEVHFDDTDAADPFFAHCKVHSEKEILKKRKRNFQLYRLHLQKKRQEKLALPKDDPEQARNQRKLLKIRAKYVKQKMSYNKPWVPTQKMSRLLTSSASACRRLLAKAKIMSVDIELLERQDIQIAALNDVRKKWYIPPAFNVEFMSYYFDRIERGKRLKEEIGVFAENLSSLNNEQETLNKNLVNYTEQSNETKGKNDEVSTGISSLYLILSELSPNKTLTPINNIGITQVDSPQTPTPPTRPISVPTAAALKMGVGFPLAHLGPPGTKVDSTRLLSTHAQNSPTTVGGGGGGGSMSGTSTPTLNLQIYDCGICKRSSDQNNLAKCDTCQLYYHLGCLNPPLIRPPKKSKLYGWQCSECDKSDEEEVIPEVPKGPRKARTRFNKDGSIILPEEQKEPEPKIPKKEVPKRHTLGDVPVLKNAKVSIKRTSNKTLPTILSTNATTTAPKAAAPTADKDTAITVTATKRPAPKTDVTAITQAAKKPATATANVAPQVAKAKTTKSPVKKTKTAAAPTKIPQPVEANLMVEPLLELPTNIMPPSNPSIIVDLTTDEDPLNVTTAETKDTNNAVLNETADISKQSRKQKRKEKHRNKHNLSLEDDGGVPTKEHKRKRKKKYHDLDYLTYPPMGIPKIKVKFKTLPAPGEKTPETRCVYVRADMVRSAEEGSRPSSVETIEDTPAETELTTTIPVQESPQKSTNATTVLTRKRQSSSRKRKPKKPNGFLAAAATTTGKANSSPTLRVNEIMNCSVCQLIGAPTNIVTCDECHKHYHFTCLEPPVKKSPKIRGYSWHCADCDPSDFEKM